MGYERYLRGCKNWNKRRQGEKLKSVYTRIFTGEKIHLQIKLEKQTWGVEIPEVEITACWHLKQKWMAHLSTGTNLHCTMHQGAKPKRSFPQAQYPTGIDLSGITNLDCIMPIGWLTWQCCPRSWVWVNLYAVQRLDKCLPQLGPHYC